MNKSKLKSDRINRRSFVKLLPAAGAAGLAVSKSPLKAFAQTPTVTVTPGGPTMTPTPGSSRISTGSGNDLKPRSLTARRCTQGT